MMPLRKNKTSQNQIGKEKALMAINQTDKEVTSEGNSETGTGVLSKGELSLLCENFYEIMLCYFHN